MSYKELLKQHYVQIRPILIKKAERSGKRVCCKYHVVLGTLVCVVSGDADDRPIQPLRFKDNLRTQVEHSCRRHKSQVCNNLSDVT